MPKIIIQVFAVLFCLLMSYQGQTADNIPWRTINPENLVVMTLPQGDVYIELAPWAAPKHVAQFKQLIKSKHYANSKFYRVIDGFVAQAGPDETHPDAAPLSMESEQPITQDFHWQLAETHDMFAPATGFYQGFAMAIDEKSSQRWLLHCPGIIAMARGNEANSATSHFYITIGQAPRYLDRIMTIFGRVVYGMDKVQAIKRTQVVAGDDPVQPNQYTPIVDMNLMSERPTQFQTTVKVLDTETDFFAHKLQARRERNSAFFYKKPPKRLDVCQIPIDTQIIKSKR
jgi:peptidylprolyl isomerase